MGDATSQGRRGFVGQFCARANLGEIASATVVTMASDCAVRALFWSWPCHRLTPLPAGEAASNQSPIVAGLAPGTQLIGSKVVAIAPPAAPKTESFNRVAGPITPSRLRIPSIGVDAQIGAVGLRSDGSMDVPDNLWTSSWLAKGPRPGQTGNVVIAGHRGVGTPALFSHLESVQPGDRIYVSDNGGQRARLRGDPRRLARPECVNPGRGLRSFDRAATGLDHMFRPLHGRPAHL